MTIAIPLLLGSAVVALTAPRLLHHLGDRAVDPAAVIVGWVLAVVGVGLTLCANLVIMAVPGYAADAVALRLRYLAAVTEPPSRVGRLSRCGVLGMLFAPNRIRPGHRTFLRYG